MVLRSPVALLLAAIALFAAAPAAAELSSAERKMVQTIDAEQERTIALLERWVNQNSGTLNLAGVEAVARMVAPEFEALGFEAQWIDMKAAGRAGHLIARHKGNGRGKRMLLIAHLDTVFEPHSPFQHWVRRGDVAEGPGVVDDKGGIAVILAALRAMHAAGTLRNADIIVALTGDEEDVGEPAEIARRDLIAAGEWADVALDFEGLARDQGRDWATLARRSSGAWTLTVNARSGHSSGIFAEGVGYGAIYELARIVDAFRRELGEEMLTYNVGLVAGGETVEMSPEKIRMQATGKTNIIAPIAIARGDLRAINEEQIARTREKMRAIVARSLPGTRASISFDAGYPPMAPTEGNRALLGKLNAVNRDMGLAEMAEYDPLKRGAADISFVARDIEAGLAGLGPAGANSHAPGETVDIPTIFLQAKRAAILMSRLARERR